jgi:hypothetical protein
MGEWAKPQIRPFAHSQPQAYLVQKVGAMEMNTRTLVGFLMALLAVVRVLPAAAQPPEAEGQATPQAAAPAPAATAATAAAETGAGEGQPGEKFRQSLLGAAFSLALPPLLLVGWGAFLALLTLGHVFWPRLIQREYTVLIERPGKSLGWGVLWTVGYLILAVVLGKAAGLGQFLAGLLSLATLAAVFLGLTGTAVSLGGQVLALARRNGASPLARLAAGTALITLIALIPIFGQLLFLYFVVIGLGAFRLAATSLAPPVPVAEEVWPAPEVPKVN